MSKLMSNKVSPGANNEESQSKVRYAVRNATSLSVHLGTKEITKRLLSRCQ